MENQPTNPNENQNQPPPKIRPSLLELNPNEFKWLRYAVGPCKGWFVFGLHGNPPFEAKVELLNTNLDKLVGYRTQDLDPKNGKEIWIVGIVSPARTENIQVQYELTHWRPIRLKPRTLWERIVGMFY